PIINVSQDTTATSQDVGYATSGDYQSDSESQPDIFVPFANLNSQSNVNTNWNISRSDGLFRLESTIPTGIYPTRYAIHQTCPTEECAQDNFDAKMKGQSLQITYPAVLSYEADLGKGDIQPCDSSNKVGTVSPQDNKSIRVTTADPQSTCIGYAMSTLSQDRGYVLEIITDHISGRNLTFYMTDLTKKQTVLDDILNTNIEYYVIPPRSTTGIGYSMVFQDSPFHGAKHENILKSVRMYELPFESIARLQFQSLQPRQLNKTTDSKIRSVQKNSYYSYTVQVDIQDSSRLVLDQAYESGWIGLEMQPAKLSVLPHVKVNGWANGFRLPASAGTGGQGENSTIILLFWPQYLEYGGFVIGLGTIGILLWKSFNQHKHHNLV
nr:hypothetical protein [Candidatus Woesebacteria bacterium]